MQVRIRLHGTLRKYLPQGSTGNLGTVDVPEGARIADLLAQLGIPAEHAKMLVSGDEQLDGSAVLREGQEVNVFPPLAGGA
jgi:sulfur carrier protein ThiS